MTIVSFIISILAFLLSLINFVITLRDKKRNLSIVFEDILAHGSGISCITHKRMNAVKVKFTFSNKSQLPIAITKVRMMVDGVYYDIDMLPHEVFRIGEKDDSKIVINSDLCPIQISSLGASLNYFTFLVPFGKIKKECTTYRFKICTNRGNPIEAEFTLNEEKVFKSDFLRKK